jgi:hypothetical protein
LRAKTPKPASEDDAGLGVFYSLSGKRALLFLKNDAGLGVSACGGSRARVILPLFKRDLLPPFWGISKLGQKPGIWAFWPKPQNLLYEKRCHFGVWPK